MILEGHAFWAPTPPNDRHLFFVVSDPTKHPDKLAVVNMTEWDQFDPADPACILEPGEHAHCKKRSWIVYEKAKVVSVKKIEEFTQAGTFTTAMAPAGPDLLKKLREGVRDSLADKKIKRLLVSQGIIQPIPDL